MFFKVFGIDLGRMSHCQGHFKVMGRSKVKWAHLAMYAIKIAILIAVLNINLG